MTKLRIRIPVHNTKFNNETPYQPLPYVPLPLPSLKPKYTHPVLPPTPPPTPKQASTGCLGKSCFSRWSRKKGGTKRKHKRTARAKTRKGKSRS